MSADCDFDRLGLTDGQLAALTGFTTRAVRALAHLREAWVNADSDNAEAVEASIRALVQGHSFESRTMREICRAVLSVGLEDRLGRQNFLRSVGL
jgi:sulfite reductase beta subunit-like hemoprotein